MIIADCIEYVKMMKYTTQLWRLCRLAFFYFYSIQRQLRIQLKYHRIDKCAKCAFTFVFKIIYEGYSSYVMFVIQQILCKIVL